MVRGVRPRRGHADIETGPPLLPLYIKMMVEKCIQEDLNVI